MRNLLQETLEAIETSNHTPYDIIFIGRDKCFQFSFEDFRLLADNIYARNDAKLEELNGLIIMFSDNTWLELEYDGSKWWKYVTLF